MDKLQDLRGLYRGFGPTDESAVGVGEVEISINETEVNFRIATGLEIQKDTFEISDFVLAENGETEELVKSLEEARAQTPESKDEELGLKGYFKHKSGIPMMIFLETSSGTQKIMILRVVLGMGEILGRIILSDDKTFVEEVAGNLGDEFPRLCNNGKAGYVPTS